MPVVIERIEVQADGGAADARLLLPEGEGPFPLVLFFMDAIGLRPTLTAMGGRLVEAGYAVLQPDLYRRSQPYEPFDYATVFQDDEARPRLIALMNSFTPEQAMADARLLVEHVAQDPRVAAARIGCVGYCMGGRMTLFAASALSDRVVAAASIHGGGLVTPAANSPHLGAPRIRGRLYVGVAAHDMFCPPEAVDALASALVSAGVQHHIEQEATALHGYAVPDSPVYDEAAAERHWERVLALFRETLA